MIMCKSGNVYDDCSHLVKVIESCNTKSHFIIALKMYRLYLRRYKIDFKHEVNFAIVNAFLDHPSIKVNGYNKMAQVKAWANGHKSYVLQINGEFVRFDLKTHRRIAYNNRKYKEETPCTHRQ